MRHGQGSESAHPIRGRAGRGYPASTVMAWLACGVLMPVAAQDVKASPPQQHYTGVQESRVAVSIPAQPLLSALRAFGLQTQSQVLFHEALLAGREAVAVYGAYTPQEALELLLARTGLTIATVRARSFTLKVARTGPQARRAVPATAIS